MTEASCHCGAVRFVVETAPVDLNSCNCSICRRYGALWGCYQRPQVRFAAENGPTDVYLWGDRDLEFHRCRTCGCITQWMAADRTHERMGVNARLLTPAVPAAIPVSTATALRCRSATRCGRQRLFDVANAPLRYPPFGRTPPNDSPTAGGEKGFVVAARLSLSLSLSLGEVPALWGKYRLSLWGKYRRSRGRAPAECQPSAATMVGCAPTPQAPSPPDGRLSGRGRGRRA